MKNNAFNNVSSCMLLSVPSTSYISSPSICKGMWDCGIDLHLFVYLLLPREQGILLRSPSHDAAKNLDITNGEEP